MRGIASSSSELLGNFVFETPFAGLAFQLGFSPTVSDTMCNM